MGPMIVVSMGPMIDEVNSTIVTILKTLELIILSRPKQLTNIYSKTLYRVFCNLFD